MGYDILKLGSEYENSSATEVLGWALDTFKGKIAFANSFGAEDVVLTDMIAKLNPKARIFTLDTGRLPNETYDVWQKLEEKYSIRIMPCFPDREAVETMVTEHGPNLFYRSIDLRKLCCHIRKLEPLKKGLLGMDAWVTGLRREQAVTRAEVKKIEVDPSQGNIIKINPLADWTEVQVWSYIKENGVPCNSLHEKNYPSIGCAPCTRPIKPGEDIRAGRWWWEMPEQKECGLHVKEE